MEKFEDLERAMCKELEAIEQKVKGGKEMTDMDLDRADKLAHAMKSLATYKAMKDAEEYETGMSGGRGHGMYGRYVSRDDGYSGHYEGYYPPRYPERRW